MIISTGTFAAGVSDEDAGDLSIDSNVHEFTLSASHHGQRLDLVLCDCVGGFSRSYLKQHIVDGAVRLDGRSVTKPAHKVVAGQRLVIDLRPTEQSQAFAPQSMDLNVLYQDEALLVLHKPAGLVVHPAAGNWSGTLLNGLLALDPVHMMLPRAGIVHRLDKDTSGLMVVARTRQCMDALVGMLADHEVSRQYLALAHRAWMHPAQISVNQAIGRDPSNRIRMAVVDMDRSPGKHAVTHFHCLQSKSSDPAFCLVQARLETGRTHQIRVHMRHLGHPLVADTVYGGHCALGMARQALHAFSLAFMHPVHGKKMFFQSPLPPDMKAALSELGWDTIPLTPLDE